MITPWESGLVLRSLVERGTAGGDETGRPTAHVELVQVSGSMFRVIFVADLTPLGVAAGTPVRVVLDPRELPLGLDWELEGRPPIRTGAAWTAEQTAARLEQTWRVSPDRHLM